MSKPVEVLITHSFANNLVAQLSEVSPDLHITTQPTRIPEEISAELWKRTEVLYTIATLPEPDMAPKLRWIQFHQAGINQVAEAPILRQPDLIATTMSGANATQVAEYVLTMLLALGHHLPDMFSLQGRNNWPADRKKQLTPIELRGSTVGIVGYGSIGRQVARLLREFGVAVLATKHDAMNPKDGGYTLEGTGDPEGDLVRRLYPGKALRSMFQECDFIVVTVPLTPETRGMIAADQLAALKPTAFLVDASQGGVVDHKALVEALNENKFAGAALDVFPEEPLPTDSPLWELPNVIITPHVAGMASQYDQRAAALFSQNLQRYLDKLPLYNQFDAERGY
jgi:phosphoglycerate dehydrogenase-like enzyme